MFEHLTLRNMYVSHIMSFTSGIKIVKSLCSDVCLFVFCISVITNDILRGPLTKYFRQFIKLIKDNGVENKPVEDSHSL